MPPTAQPASATAGTRNRPLPPTIENAYHRKCIDLKRRINEVEASNDVARLRKSRIERSIAKLRLERAFLLEKLAERMDYNVDESDDSASPPPSPQPQDKPLRHKRTRKSSPPPVAASNSQGSPPSNNPYNIQTFSATPGAPGTPGPTQSSVNANASAAVNGTSADGAADETPGVLRTVDATQYEEDEGGAVKAEASHMGNGTSGEHADEKATGKENSAAAVVGNGQSEDVEMSEAGAGGGFTAVNR